MSTITLKLASVYPSVRPKPGNTLNFFSTLERCYKNSLRRSGVGKITAAIGGKLRDGSGCGSREGSNISIRTLNVLSDRHELTILNDN